MNKSANFSMFTWLKKQLFLFSKFGIVGILAAALDISLFNLLAGGFSLPSLESKIISGLLSTLFAWVGNRYWTFRKFRRRQRLTEVLEYFLVAAGGLFISVSCLWVSHYLLGYTSLLADNISGNIIGLFLATVFRFMGNQYWVFSSKRNQLRVVRNKVDKSC